MVNFPGRNGRRRRVLNDEVLSASGGRVALHVPADEHCEAPPRYSDAAGVENHPQITDFVPRRYSTIAMLLAIGMVSTAALAGIHAFAPMLAAMIGADHVMPFDLESSSSIASWISAVVLLLGSASCLLIYSLRRYKIDDIRGRYRIWIAASAACLFLSFNSVTGIHQVASQALSHLSGWSALRDGAVWWIALAGLPALWIAFRSLLDVKECRLAAALMIGAFACYATATSTYLGMTPGIDSPMEPMVSRSLLVAGHWFFLASVISYARFVVLDAQGLIAHRQASSQPSTKKSKSSSSEKKTAGSTTTSNAVDAPLQKRSQPQIKPAESPASLKSWVDGRRCERDQYEDEGDEEEQDSSKLSKSDRKRLRKLKAQNRAA